MSELNEDQIRAEALDSGYQHGFERGKNSVAIEAVKLRMRCLELAKEILGCDPDMVQLYASKYAMFIETGKWVTPHQE